MLIPSSWKDCIKWGNCILDCRMFGILCLSSLTCRISSSKFRKVSDTSNKLFLQLCAVQERYISGASFILKGIFSGTKSELESIELHSEFVSLLAQHTPHSAFQYHVHGQVFRC